MNYGILNYFPNVLVEFFTLVVLADRGSEATEGSMTIMVGGVSASIHRLEVGWGVVGLVLVQMVGHFIRKEFPPKFRFKGGSVSGIRFSVAHGGKTPEGKGGNGA